ncbi:MAG: Unknown protein [uncultured Sulfurovum sp.]|uniref:Peptidase C39-like domain-containing protein n=1 Tax=uncultured Sulfurovum sp. TaxID=269237 RepID=A0A6S6T706_9BACT|nr:MAG: Unknown protein [uncultured Sulfurovum sp.]
MNLILGRYLEPIETPKFYNQRDKNWASDKLGNTNETVGKVGCLISSVSMNFSYYDIDINPKVLNQKLKEANGYTNRGWLIWNKLLPISNNKLVVSFPTLSHKNIEKYLLEKKPVLTKVFIHKIIPHWILIVGKKDKEYLMLDPLTNGELTKVSHYGDSIYSIRVLEEK